MEELNLKKSFKSTGKWPMLEKWLESRRIRWTEVECYHQNKAFQPQEKYSKAFPLFWCLTRSYIFITLTFLGLFPMHQGIGLLGDKSRRTGLFVFHLPRLPLAMPACLLGAWANPSFYPRSNNQRAVSLTLINSLIKLYLPAASNITWALPSFNVENASPSIPIYYLVCN